MADQPYIKWWTSDFLTGVLDLSAEETGVYAILLTLMADRGGPLPDEPQWLARRCNTTTRAFNRARDRLIELGKIERRNAMLGNRRMMNEIKDRDAKSKQASDAARARWDKWAEEHPLSLPFEENGEKTGGKPGEKPAEKTKLNGAKKSGKRQKTANPAVRTNVSPSRRARAFPEPESRIHPTNLVERASEVPGAGGDDDGDDGVKVPRLADADLQTLYAAVAEASGHNPASPAQIDRAMGFIETWRKDGLDFDEVVIPTIRSMIAKTDEPTRSLSRFDAAVRHQQARRGATPKGRAYKAPATPILQRDDEPPVMAELRAALLARLGPATFCSYVNPVRFVDLGDQVNGRTLRIEDRPPPLALMDGGRPPIVRAVAQSLGFTAVW